MLKISDSPLRRGLFAAALAILTAIALGGLFYVQAKSWLLTQQNTHLSMAARQLNTLTENLDKAARSASALAELACSPAVQHELRRLLALAPNVANIELSRQDVIYCSSLTGLEHQVMHDHHQLYLTNEIEELPGHPYLVLRLGQKQSAVFASADGYYLRNILESASIQLPVVVITPEGWMGQDGIIRFDPVPDTFNLSSTLTTWPYRLVSRVDSRDVLKIIINDGKTVLVGILLVSFLAGTGFFLWSGRSRPIVQRLREAIQNNDITPYIQPIVRSSDFRPVGGEVLSRWVEQGTAVPPEQFIALAEQNGLIVPLTQSLIGQVAAGLASDFQPEAPFYLSFNVSSPHFASPQLIADFSCLSEAPAQNIHLMLEITEREALMYNENVTANIARLKELGIRLALDDFGTGYSSLEYFQHIHIDAIKIDKIFVQRLGDDPLSDHIIANVTDLASRLGLTIIAEGVETASQAALLREKGVDFLQGYLFSRPMPLADFKVYMNHYDS